MCQYGGVSFISASSDARARFSRKLLGLGAVAAVGVLVLAACASGASSADITSTNDNVQFNECTPEICDTTLNGTPIKIKMPVIWNGTLLVFSQGYRGEEPIPPAKTVAPAGQLGPAGSLDGIIPEAMVKAGYAVATGVVPATGWHIDQQLKAADLVQQQFVDKIARPDRIYVWGESSGALTSIQLSQTRDWVNGAIGYCGMLAGFNKNYDLALDAAVAVKTLLYPKLKLTGYSSLADAKKNYDGAMKAVKKAAKDPYSGNGAMQLYSIAVAAEVPMSSKTQAGTAPRIAATGIADNLSTVLARTTLDRYGLEQQFGGNPSSNVGTDYLARATVKEVKEADEVKKGALAKYLKKIQDSKRVAPDKEPRAKAAVDGNLTGEIKVPTVTLHTEFDPLAIVQNEGDLVGKAVEVGNDSRRMLSVSVTSPPMFYTKDDPAKYGVGHCNFTDQSIVGAVKVLNTWVRESKFPTRMSIAEALGKDSGFAPDFPLYTWPGGAKP